MGSETSSAKVGRRCTGFLKICIIQLTVEPQIRISTYSYTPMKIWFKQPPLPKFWLRVAS